MKIRLTKIRALSDNKSSTYSDAIRTQHVWEGDAVMQKKIYSTLPPVVGKPFIISTYKTSLIQEVLSENTFRTYNSIYKFEILANKL